MASVYDRWHRTAWETVTDPVTGATQKVRAGKARTARYGRGKRWEARWRDEAGVDQHKAFERKIDAERHASTVEADTVRGTYVDPNAGRITLRKSAEKWRTAQVHRVSTEAQVETNLRRHVYPLLGDRSIGAIRPSDIQTWVKWLGTTGDGRKALAPPTIRVVYRYVAAIFRAAVADRLIPSSPCVGVTLPKTGPRRVEPPAGQHVAAVVGKVGDRYRALLILGAGTGVRQGEAFGVELGHVDFLRRTLRIDQQLVHMPGEPPKIAPPKTEKSHRTIPLSASVLAALSAHVAGYPPVPVEMVDVTGPVPVTRMAVLLFTDDDRGPLRRTSFSAQVWQPARKAAGAPESLTFHGLRHYFASALIRFGESVKTVQARLGHASASETLDTYSHLWPDSEDRTRQAIEAALTADVRQMCATEATS